MFVGYARTCTQDQAAGLEAQFAELKRAGCAKIFLEQMNAVDVGKGKELELEPELESAIGYVREGDTLIVTKIERLAHSLPHLLQVIGRLERQGVALRILSMQINTSTPNGKLMLSVMGAIVEFERALMLERQLDGIAAWNQARRFKGRRSSARPKINGVSKSAPQGLIYQAVAEQPGMRIASVLQPVAKRPRPNLELLDACPGPSVTFEESVAEGRGNVYK
ncbi:Site-specific DNA recombinase [Nitrosospira sp. Nl5]|uniref:recombinase family protein n=1 Tax=Nitrosospira sp. Nl5 TaxID=200120 RepID=UPI00088A8E7B|nr:recombinase family protein [Nitrosospira sp. Nl5]SCY57389.1 Site-specific DNA recombinase [Nitrosospira sp. Nl5]